MGKRIPKAVLIVREALQPPSSGRILAGKTGVSQTTLCQIANRVVTNPRAITKKNLKKSLGIEEGDWA